MAERKEEESKRCSDSLARDGRESSDSECSLDLCADRDSQDSEHVGADMGNMGVLLRFAEHIDSLVSLFQEL